MTMRKIMKSIKCISRIMMMITENSFCKKKLGRRMNISNNSLIGIKNVITAVMTMIIIIIVLITMVMMIVILFK